MTRLKEQWVRQIEDGLPGYEMELLRKTGLNFAGIAARTGGATPQQVQKAAQSVRAAVVPVTSGEGVIGGFAHAVAAILRQAGFTAAVTRRADVDGLYEAHTGGAQLVFAADDDRYIGLRLRDGRVSDNNEATARGYVELLEVMAGEPLAGKEVLVLGGGIIGRLAAALLAKKDARPVQYDKNRAILKAASDETGATPLDSPEEIATHRYILDATNEAGWLTADMLHPKAIISAPGVPLSLDEAALAAYQDRLVHDLLHIGTLAMLGELCAS